jgi:hypothetical protein
MKRKPLRSARADARKPRELCDEVVDGWAQHCLIVPCRLGSTGRGRRFSGAACPIGEQTRPRRAIRIERWNSGPGRRRIACGS